MKRIYHRYEKWEDFQHGLYMKTIQGDEKYQEDLTRKCMNLLSNQNLFFQVARDMINSWPISADVNLSNTNKNQQAWVGQASCCYELGVPEFITKFAWNMLQPEERIEANKTADAIIKIWRGVKFAK